MACRQEIPRTVTAKLLQDQDLKPFLWGFIDQNLPQVVPDFNFWWNKAGLPYVVLLQEAGYSTASQLQQLLFFYYYVIPELGAACDANGMPRDWKSFMTDHFSPIEFSWEWGPKYENPSIRYSIEPIGPIAGTPMDPFNQHATTQLAHRYQRLFQNCDLTLFEYFSDHLLSYETSDGPIEKSGGEAGHSSRSFLAIDSSEGGTMLKAYFIPTFKARVLGRSTWDIIALAIENLPGYSPPAFQGFVILQNFLMSQSQSSDLEAEIFAIDCVAPAESRLKIYMRNRSTSFASVKNVMTLGGALDDPALAQNLEDLHQLWKLVFSEERGRSAHEELPAKDHRTAGTLYYFDIKQGKAHPGVKVYLPVRHYGLNDLAIANGLRAFLKRRGHGARASNYLQALERVAHLSVLRSRCGLQTYIGCSFTGGELRLTSYLAPEVYKLLGKHTS